MSKEEQLQEFVEKVLQGGILIRKDQGSIVMLVCHEGTVQDVSVMPDPDASMIGDLVLKAMKPPTPGGDDGEH